MKSSQRNADERFASEAKIVIVAVGLCFAAFSYSAYMRMSGGWNPTPPPMSSSSAMAEKKKPEQDSSAPVLLTNHQAQPLSAAGNAASNQFESSEPSNNRITNPPVRSFSVDSAPGRNQMRTTFSPTPSKDTSSSEGGFRIPSGQPPQPSHFENPAQTNFNPPLPAEERSTTPFGTGDRNELLPPNADSSNLSNVMPLPVHNDLRSPSPEKDPKPNFNPLPNHDVTPKVEIPQKQDGEFQFRPSNEEPDSNGVAKKSIASEPPSTDNPESDTRPKTPNDKITAGENESFWTIAQRVYDDGRYFHALYEVNRNLVPDFETIEPGTVLLAPSKSELEERFPNLCPGRASSTEDQETDSSKGDQPETDGSPNGHYVTQKGDTLFDIARWELGQASRYHEILKLNVDQLPIYTRSDSPLKAGIKLKIPAKTVSGDEGR